MKPARKLSILIIILLIPSFAIAQKKIISEARQYVKSGKNLAVAERLMANILNDSLSEKQGHEARLLLFESLKKQYEQENEKIYLKQPYDTLNFFVLNKKLFHVADDLDKFEKSALKSSNNKNGKLKSIGNLLPNVLYGAYFYTQKGIYSEGFDYSKMFISYATNVFLTPNIATDSLIYKAASLCVYCGYKLGDFNKTMEYSQLALNNKQQEPFIYQYMAEAYKQNNDKKHYIEILNSGFNRYPSFPFFFPHIIDYYIENRDYEHANAIVEKALSFDKDNDIYIYAKTTILLNTGKYDECINLCLELLQKNDTISEVYYNAGAAYFNKAIDIYKMQKNKKQQQKINELYNKALPFMEHFRSLAPDMKQKWFPILYTIYLNLNLGDKFEELNSIK